MRAAVYYGAHAIRVLEHPDPGLPAPDEIQLEVLAASLCGTDVEEYLNGPNLVPLHSVHPSTGHRGPVVLGHEIVGVVKHAGEQAQAAGWIAGTRVVPGSGVSCGRCRWCCAGRSNLCTTYYTIGLHCHGGLAQLVNVPVSVCRHVSDDIPASHAVMAQPLAVALHAVQRCCLTGGEIVMVVGVGGVGSLVVAGCIDRGVTVLAVDIAAGRLEKARALGARAIVHAGEEDARVAVQRLTANAGADVVVEASGSPDGLSLALGSVRAGGVVNIVGLHRETPPMDLQRLVLREVTIATSKVHLCDSDLPAAIDLISRQPHVPEMLLESEIALDDVVEGGFERMAAGDVNGKVVVRP